MDSGASLDQEQRHIFVTTYPILQYCSSDNHLKLPKLLQFFKMALNLTLWNGKNVAAQYQIIGLQIALWRLTFDIWIVWNWCWELNLNHSWLWNSSVKIINFTFCCRIFYQPDPNFNCPANILLKDYHFICSILQGTNDNKDGFAVNIARLLCEYLQLFYNSQSYSLYLTDSLWGEAHKKIG